MWTTLLMPRLIILVMLASRPTFTESLITMLSFPTRGEVEVRGTQKAYSSQSNSIHVSPCYCPRPLLARASAISKTVKLNCPASRCSALISEAAALYPPSPIPILLTWAELHQLLPRFEPLEYHDTYLNFQLPTLLEFSQMPAFLYVQM